MESHLFQNYNSTLSLHDSTLSLHDSTLSLHNSILSLDYLFFKQIIMVITSHCMCS